MKRGGFLTCSFLLITAACSGCSDDSASEDSQIPVVDNGVTDVVTVQDAGFDFDTHGEPMGDMAVPGVATDVQLSLHDNKVKVVLSTMTVLGEQETTWDIFVSHGDPVDQLPHIELGEGVTAQILGTTTPFHDVDVAPTDGYEADDPANQTYVIGSTWRDGGAGTEGFNMTGNIYAIKLADGTYVKIEVLSAKSGAVHILAYRQPNADSTDLATAAQ